MTRRCDERLRENSDVSFAFLTTERADQAMTIHPQIAATAAVA